MEKVGIDKETLLNNLRNEEANLMSAMSQAMSDRTKTAEDRSQLEMRLQQVRHKITELDLGKSE